MGGRMDGLEVALRNFAQGCISGHVAEWPQLLPALRWAVEEIDRLRAPVPLPSTEGGKCDECKGTGRTFNHVTGEVECDECEGSGEAQVPAGGDTREAVDLEADFRAIEEFMKRAGLFGSEKVRDYVEKQAKAAILRLRASLPSLAQPITLPPWAAGDFTQEFALYNMLMAWTPDECKEFFAMLSLRPDFNPGAQPKGSDTAREGAQS